MFSDLSAPDVDSVMKKLDELKIPHKLENGGSAIAVASDRYYDAKMQVAAAGLPTSGTTGFELFDKKSMGMTDFQQKINYLRALQGELSRTITQIEGVQGARVHIALPDESLFIKDKKPATASVVLKLAPNINLKKDQIDGIVFLMSSSIDKLEPENVTIIDHKGRLLSSKRDENSANANTGQLDYERAYEADLERRIIALLAPTIGQDKLVAKVTANLDFRKITKTEEIYDPDSQVARSEQVTNESQSGSQNNASAAPGTDANVPGESPAGEGTSSSNSQNRKLQTINYEISHTVSQITEPMNKVVNLSIAVLIDGPYKTVKDAEGKEKLEFAPRPEEEMKRLTELIKKAVGFSAERKDQIEVANIPFRSDLDNTEKLMPQDRKDLYLKIGHYALVGIGVLLFFFLILRPLIQWLTSEPTFEANGDLATLLPSGVIELERKIGQTHSLTSGEPQDKIKIDTDSQVRILEENRIKVLENAQKDKRAVTLMIRKWLKE